MLIPSCHPLRTLLLILYLLCPLSSTSLYLKTKLLHKISFSRVIRKLLTVKFTEHFFVILLNILKLITSLFLSTFSPPCIIRHNFFLALFHLYDESLTSFMLVFALCPPPNFYDLWSSDIGLFSTLSWLIFPAFKGLPITVS